MFENFLFPLILAGPILRRVEPSVVWVWLATSEPVEVWGGVYTAESTLHAEQVKPPLVGEGRAASKSFGGKLFITMLGIRPLAPVGYPDRVLLAYNMEVRSSTESVTLDTYELFKGEDGLGYDPYRLPTFFMVADGNVNLLQGSCRKPHGDDVDAMAIIDDPLPRPASWPIW